MTKHIETIAEEAVKSTTTSEDSVIEASTKIQEEALAKSSEEENTNFAHDMASNFSAVQKLQTVMTYLSELQKTKRKTRLRDLSEEMNNIKLIVMDVARQVSLYEHVVKMAIDGKELTEESIETDLKEQAARIEKEREEQKEKLIEECKTVEDNK